MMTVSNGGSGGLVQLFGRISVGSKLILLIYIASFAGATFNHVSDIFSSGFLYADAADVYPLWIRIYWSSLTIFDPLAALFLFLNIKKGIVLYFIIIVSDVVINFSIIALTRGPSAFLNFFNLSQSAFLIFLFITSRIVLKELKEIEKY